jgi:serine protease Do
MARFLASFASGASLLFAAAVAAQGQFTPPAAPIDPAVQGKLIASIVAVRVNAVENARSNAELGRERAGTGVVADRQGHVLTSIFIVQESDSISLTTADGRTVPATVVLEDHGTGVAILRPGASLAVPPMPLGQSADVRVEEPVLIVAAAHEKEVTLAHVVSRRDFAGSWEYLVDNAIVTAPPASTWAGAALVNGSGQLVGIGSLLLGNSTKESASRPSANLFVPVDLYRAGLERVSRGDSKSPRPWLGVTTEQKDGRVVVLDVSAGSPAGHAGVQPGDQIVALNGERIADQAQLYRQLWSQDPRQEVRLTIQRESQTRELRVKPVDAGDRLIERADFSAGAG